MKYASLLLAGAWLACAHTAFAAPQTYAEPERVRFVPKAGDWAAAKNWSNHKVPAGDTRVYIPGDRAVTVASKVDLTDNLNLGSDNGKPATLSILKGARVKVSFLSTLGTAKNAESVVYLRGGELAVGNDKETYGMLHVGAEASYSGKATVEFIDGSFKGGIVVGNAVPQTQTGVLRVRGSQAAIAATAAGRNFFKLADSGTLEFVLDKKGVSTLDYRDTRALLEGGRIVVDGKAYDGPSREIPLIVAKKIVSDTPTPNVEILNFSPRYAVDVVRKSASNGAETLVLRVVQK